jgi:hypothetical protein
VVPPPFTEDRHRWLISKKKKKVFKWNATLHPPLLVIIRQTVNFVRVNFKHNAKIGLSCGKIVT